MHTVIKDTNGIHELSLDASLTLSRIIFLEGDIDDEMSGRFTKQLMAFWTEDPESPVKVFIRSDGGSIDAGMVIYDAIQSSPMPIKLYGIGRAYSMAAVILASGKHGRYLLPHSRMMIHEPLIASTIGGKTSSVCALAYNLIHTKEEMDKILSKHTGQPLEKIAEMTRGEHFFTASEAVAFGLVDGIKGFDEMIREEEEA
ncbi:ClpP family protease [Mitsuokella sp.]|uniref:ClpP family protease n=1 Tax=unclassified Mitsuokella TaxID=2637239 RepID=UPI003D7D8AC8